jgi:hypothetical protein
MIANELLTKPYAAQDFDFFVTFAALRASHDKTPYPIGDVHRATRWAAGLRALGE